jgi:hypothetical protein
MVRMASGPFCRPREDSSSGPSPCRCAAAPREAPSPSPLNFELSAVVKVALGAGRQVADSYLREYTNVEAMVAAPTGEEEVL